MIYGRRRCASVVTRLILFFSLVASINCFADLAGSLDPATLLQFRNISELEYSKERHALLFVVSESAEVPGGLQSIWMLDLKTDEARKLTVKAKVNEQPCWCPESNCLTFISDRDGKRAIYRLSMAGGEAEKVSTSETDISAYAWAPGKDLLVYVTDAGNEQKRDSKSAEEHTPDIAIEEMVTVVRPVQQHLWLLDMTNAEVRQLTQGDWQISSFDWAPDGKSIVLSATADVVSEVEHERLFILNLTDREMRELWRPSLPM